MRPPSGASYVATAIARYSMSTSLTAEFSEWVGGLSSGAQALFTGAGEVASEMFISAEIVANSRATAGAGVATTVNKISSLSLAS